MLGVGRLGGGVVQHAFFVSLCVGNCIKHLHRPQVQRSLCDFIGILAVCAVGDSCLDAAVAVALVRDVPFTGERRKQHLHGKARGQRRLQKLHEKILNVFRRYPGSTQPHRNLAGVEVLRLYLLQRLHVDLIVRVGRCGQPGNSQLLPHIAGKIFVSRQINRLGLLRVVEDNAGQIADDFALRFSRDLCHVGKVHTGLLGQAQHQRFIGGVHMVHHLSRADGPLREHIRLAPVMALAVDVLQRAEQEIPGILTERRSRAAAVD